jgi:heme/copper-type cytochrome/quinol oxidase subunit 1
MTSPSARPARPRVVEVAFWLLALGAVLLIVGGMLAATMSYDTIRALAAQSVSDDVLRKFLLFSRAIGVFCALAGAGLGFLAGRMRRGDARFRRAIIGLALALIVVVGLLAVFASVHVLALISLLPIIVGTMLLTRPAAAQWFVTDGQQAS